MSNFPMNTIKEKNFTKVFRLIYDTDQMNEKLSKQEIANQTKLSLPTVTKNLNELLEKNLILEDGKFSSQGGRKAVAYSLNRLAKVSLGVELLSDSITIVASDLLGSTISSKKIKIAYENNDHYYQDIAALILDFIKKEEIIEETILGLGIGVQGLVSADGSTILYGSILNNTDLSIDILASYFDFPCRFVHDAECVALAEIWEDHSLEDALILSIGEHLGGALIINRELYKGENRRSGTIEHTIIDPNGPTCYCGKQGCVEVFCSLHALSSLIDSDIDSFINSLSSDNSKNQAIWTNYLNSLAIALNNFHMFLDNRIIIAGELLHYFTEKDLITLREIVKEKNAFPESKELIYLGNVKSKAVPIGAAITFMQPFLDAI